MVTISEDEIRRRVRDLLTEVDVFDRVAFRGAQFDRGLAWVQFPEGRGGLGLSPKMQTVVGEELHAAPLVYDDLALNPIGIGMAAPLLVAYGTEMMKDSYLRRIFTGEDIWCQLFSEPGAGSDVASLADTCGARRRRVDRQRPEGVDHARRTCRNFGLLVARTDPDQPKHKGMSYFVVDMHAPGVEVRPLLPDHRRGRVQRGVLHRRARASRPHARATRATAGAWRSPRS